MNKWISIKKQKPSRSSTDLYLITDGEDIGWSYFGCDDEGCEHDNFIGGDCESFIQENVTHWMEIKLPNLKKGIPKRMKS